MMQKILKAFLKHSFLIHVVSLVLVIGGIFSYHQIRKDIFPKVQGDAIYVSLSFKQASISFLSKKVVKPLVSKIQAISGMEQSFVSVTHRHVFFDFSFPNKKNKLHLIRKKIEKIVKDFIQGLKLKKVYSSVEEGTWDSMRILSYALYPFDKKSHQHRRILNRILQKLKEVQEIKNVYDRLESWKLDIQFKKNIFLKYHLSFEHVLEMLQRFFLPLKGVMISYQEKVKKHKKIKLHQKGSNKQKVSNKSNLDERVGARFKKKDLFLGIRLKKGFSASLLPSLKHLVIKRLLNGKVIRVQDIANLKLYLDENIQYFFNGHPAVSLSVEKALGETDLDQFRNAVFRVVKTVSKELPKKMHLKLVSDFGVYFDMQRTFLKQSLGLGFLVLMLVLIGFLGWRVALSVFFGVPLSIFGLLLSFYVLGIPLDLLTISGLFMVLGVLVDDAIVVSENYVQEVETGLRPQRAAWKTIRFLFLPVLAMGLSTVIAFVPVVFWKRFDFLSQMSFAIWILIGVSFLECFLILPHHLKKWVGTHIRARSEKNKSKIEQIFLKIFSFGIQRRFLALGFGLIVFGVLGFLTVKHFPIEFRLKLGDPLVHVKGRLPKGQSFAQERKAIFPLQKAIEKRFGSEISSIVMIQGQSWLEGLYSEDRNEFLLKIKLKNTKRLFKNIAAFEKKIQVFLKKYPHKSQFEFLTAGSVRASGKSTHKDASQEKEKIGTFPIILLGGTLEDRDYFYQSLKTFIRKKKTQYPFLKEKFSKKGVQQVESWIFEPNLKALSEYGVSLNQLESFLLQRFDHHEVFTGSIEGEYFNIFLVPEVFSKKTLSHLVFPFAPVEPVPFRYLGTWKKKRLLSRVRFRHGLPEYQARVQYEMSKEVTDQKLQSIFSKFLKQFLKKRPDLQVILNNDQMRKKVKKEAIWFFLGALMLIFLVIACTLFSWKGAVLALLGVPFGITGALGMAVLFGVKLSIMGAFALFGVAGIGVNQAIVFLAELKKKKEALREQKPEYGDGKKGRLFISISGMKEIFLKRFRAVLLTTLTTVGATLPMAYGIGGDPKIAQSIAFPLVWGVIGSFYFTLFFLPALYLMLERIEEKSLRVFSNSIFKKIYLKTIAQASLEKSAFQTKKREQDVLKSFEQNLKAQKIKNGSLGELVGKKSKKREKKILPPPFDPSLPSSISQMEPPPPPFVD